jgi:hypothetical protein
VQSHLSIMSHLVMVMRHHSPWMHIFAFFIVLWEDTRLTTFYLSLHFRHSSWASYGPFKLWSSSLCHLIFTHLHSSSLKPTFITFAYDFVHLLEEHLHFSWSPYPHGHLTHTFPPLSLLYPSASHWPCVPVTVPLYYHCSTLLDSPLTLLCIRSHMQISREGPNWLKTMESCWHTFLLRKHSEDTHLECLFWVYENLFYSVSTFYHISCLCCLHFTNTPLTFSFFFPF